MAEGYEQFHVPQQSRRDKLRIMSQQEQSSCVESTASAAAAVTLSGCSALLPFYDPSLISSDLLTCAANAASGGSQGGFHHHHYHNQTNHQLSAANSTAAAASAKNSTTVDCVVKEEGVNFMGFQNLHHTYFDPQSSFHEINNVNPFLYTPQISFQNFRDFNNNNNNNNNNDNGEEVVYKPEPLSLSLSSHNNTQQQNNNLPLELNLQRYEVTASGYVVPTTIAGSGAGAGGSASTSNEVSRCSVPLGPFTGYASVLKGSRFLRAAQELLEELSDVGKGMEFYAEKMTPDSSLLEPPPLQNFSGVDDDDTIGAADGGGDQSRRKKSRLISMLDEVYRRYKQYYQQMQAVVASFEYVAGLGNASPFANLALKAMSKHFRCLKNAITDQLQLTNKAHGQISPRKGEVPRFVSTATDNRSLYNRTVHNSGFLEHQPVWRPQRGLPERAVTVLRAWLFEHFLHPYPTDTDKLMLAKQTGLSRSQVSNWFINARVRLWKPMVEEIHMLETRQAQKASQKDHRTSNKASDHHLSSANTQLQVSDQNPSTSTTQRTFQDSSTGPSKRTRSTRSDQLPDIPVGSTEPLNSSSYNTTFSSHPHVGVGVSMAAGASGDVSLTLGLHHQNNIGIGLSEPRFPINAAQRFGLGLEVSSDGYVIGGLRAENQHFGGQLLHDFVG